MLILSLGAGVQSTTVALMSARGDLPRFDAAIFSDTGWEPAAVYRHLDWLEAQLPFQVIRVSAGDLRADALTSINSDGKAFSAIPWHIVRPDGSKSLGRRQCTREYKLRPLQRKIVDLMGGKRPKGGARVAVGISVDEAWRMKPSRVQYIENYWPLIESRMRRRDCLTWLRDRQYPEPPKSSCIGCPFHDGSQWQALTAEEIVDAIEVDEAIRNVPGKRLQQFMHSSGRPLAEIDLRSPQEQGQGDLFINECEGMCGV